MRRLLWAIALCLITSLALASGDDLTNISKNENDLSVATGSTDSVAFAYGPDNDINDCMAHWSVLIATFPKRNKFCERQAFVAWAEHPVTHSAASIKIMCSDPMASEVFDSRDECIKVFTPLSEPPTGTTGTGEGMSGPLEKVASYIDDVQEVQVQQQQEYESLEDRLARVETGQRMAARKAQERRDYAQQTIDVLRSEDESENE